ncbi:MAG: hypothetical protein IT384_03020 [Deltaproteobacteria bacterium]|nr:hypothetical protein [Deltaproteobacteria bacterium]
MKSQWTATVLVWAVVGACRGSAPPPESVSPTPTPAAAAPTIVDAMRDLATRLKPVAPVRIAVFPFPERGVGHTLLGEYVMDKLVTSFGSDPNVKLVERARLEAVRAEHQISAGGEISDDTAVSVGNMAGAEAVVVGTLTSLGQEWEIAARVLGTEDAGVRGVGEVRFSSTGLPPGLAGVAVKERGSSRPAEGSKGGGGSPPSTSALVVFQEEFSNVEEGLAPEGWVVPDQVGVARSGAKKALASLKDGKHKLVIPNVAFPDDFELELLTEFNAHNNFQFCRCEITVGEVTAVVTSKGFALTNSQSLEEGFACEKKALITLKKAGPVFRLLVDGRQVQLSRLAKFDRPSAIVLAYNDGFQAGSFKLHRIALRDTTPK